MYRIVVVLLLIFFLPMHASASTPTQTLKDTVNKVIDVLKDQSLKGDSKKQERARKLSTIVGKTFNFKEMAKKSLDKHWNERTPEEQREFEDLFRKLLERTYSERIENYSDEEVSFLDEIIKGRYALVKTRIVNSQNKAIPVNYKMKQFDTHWEVIDVSIEGVSLVKNYRTQFNEILTNHSYSELITRLNKKLQG